MRVSVSRENVRHRYGFVSIGLGDCSAGLGWTVDAMEALDLMSVFVLCRWVAVTLAASLSLTGKSNSHGSRKQLCVRSRDERYSNAKTVDISVLR